MSENFNLRRHFQRGEDNRARTTGCRVRKDFAEDAEDAEDAGAQKTQKEKM